MHLTTGHFSGLSENNVELEQLYNQLIKNDISSSTMHFSASINALVNNGYGTPQIIRWAWWHLFSRLPEALNAKLVLTGNYNYNGEGLSATYSNADIGTAFNMTMGNNGIIDAPNQPTYSLFKIGIYRISRGINNTFDVLDAHTDLNRLKDLELPFIQSAHHKVRLYKDNRGAILMVTNQYDAEKTFWQMFGMLPVFYPEIKETIENPENEMLRNIFKAFYERNGDALMPYITEDYKEIEKIRKLKNIIKFEQSLKNIGSKQITSLRNDIGTLERNIRNYYDQVQSWDQQLQDKMRMVTGIELIGISIDTSVIDFLKNTKVIKIQDCNNDYVVFQVKTPITNYIKQDMESYYKHSNTNFVTERPWVASLMKEVFIDEKYQLVYTTTITVPLNLSNNQWQVSPNNKSHTGNPHLTHYECYSAARNLMNKFIQEGRILDMINQLIATCASLNVVDNSVMHRLIDEISIDSYDAHYHNIIQNIETGEFLSPADYKAAYLKAEQDITDTTLTAV